MLHRRWLFALVASAALLAGCASTPAPTQEVRSALAPTGKLRVGLYAGSPTSQVLDKSGQKVGITYELGRELAHRLNVPFEPVEFPRIAEVIEAMKRGEVDFTFTNATDARARDVNFTLPMVSLELGYLVGEGSQLQSASEVDRPGVRVGVTQGSSSQGTLGRMYKQAKLVPVPTLREAAELIKHGQLDAFATNKGILYELADSVPGARILGGNWGLEHMAIATPKGREIGSSYVSDFSLAVRRDGTLQSVIGRSGLRGTVEPSIR